MITRIKKHHALILIGVLFGVAPFSPATDTTRPVDVQIDMAGQVDGSRCFQFVTDTGNVFLNQSERLPDNWAIERWENTIKERADWFFLSSNTTTQQLWKVDEAGNYIFVPDPRAVPKIRETLRAGMKPRIIMATSSIPEPLIEGGFKAGHYGYNVRQPNDYPAWQKYIESTLQYLVDEFGRDEVRNWCFVFGVESDWQAEFIDPETGERLDRKANRREYMKVFDYFHAALTEVLGPSVYSGIYCAFEHQAPDYIEHWATGTNFATGKTGTRAAFIGFSDWYLINHMPDYSPFSMEGKKVRAEQKNTWVAGAGIAGGLLWKYEFINDRIEKYPSLRNFEISVPEHGFFDTKGGTRPNGKKGAVDFLPADYRGATLFAIRAIAYTHAPRLNWVNCRWILGPDTFTGNAAENVRPPRFHALRISRDMAEQRLLAVDIPEPMTEAGNEIRAAAVAADDGSGLYRMLLVNFNYDFNGGSKETVRLTLDNLPLRDGELDATAYVIDEQHNNWWRLWKEYREENGIEYQHSDGVTHLGKMLQVDEKYLDNHLYVKVTTDAEGYRAWLKKLPEYHAIDGLQPSSKSTLTVKNGSAAFSVPMESNSTLYLELRVPEPVRSDALPLIDKNWVLGEGIQITAAGEISITPNPKNGTEAALTLTGLEPRARYAWIFTADSPVRMADLEASVQPGLTGKSSAAWIDYDGVPQRLVLSGKTSSDGKLTLRLNAPAQPWEAADTILIRNQELRKIVAGGN